MSERVLPFIPAALEREVYAALDDAQIYDIGSYGWLNDNDPDPDIIGHAMWQTDQPFIDLNALLGEQPVRRRPSDLEKLILTSGEDFCGFMQLSRLSIGLALLWRQRARADPMNESPFFWLHHTDAFLKLAIAADRLRDLLVVACTGDSPKAYKRAARQNHHYATPFEKAQQLLASRGLHDPRLFEPLASLPKLGNTIFEFIARRNVIVHEVSTRFAKIVRDSVTELQERFDNEQTAGFAPRSEDPTDRIRGADERLQELRAEPDHAVAELRDWYELLIQASDCVFQVEYWSRVLGRR